MGIIEQLLCHAFHSNADVLQNIPPVTQGKGVVDVLFHQKNRSTQVRNFTDGFKNTIDQFFHDMFDHNLNISSANLSITQF